MDNIEAYREFKELIFLPKRELITLLLKQQLIINKAIERCKQEISASSIQYEREHKQQHLVYKVAHERMLDILKGSDTH